MNRPYRLTPMHQWHERHGGKMAEVAGWKRAVDYGDIKCELVALSSTAGLSDVTPISKIDVQGKQSSQMSTGFLKFRGLVSVRLPYCHGAQHCRPTSARLTKDRFIVLGRAEQNAQIYSSLNDAGSGNGSVHVTDITSVSPHSIWLSHFPKLLKKLRPARIDSIKNDRCQQSPLARVVAVLIRRDVREVPGWLILVSRDSGE